MSRMSIPFKGTVIVTLAALALGTVALTTAFASGVQSAPARAPTTAATSSQMSAQLMQSTWKSESSSLAFDNFVLSRVDRVLLGISHRTGRLGKASPMEEMAIKDFDQLLAKAQAVLTAHAGFDAKGAVTDQAQALKSIQSVGAYLDQIRSMFLFRLEHLFR